MAGVSTRTPASASSIPSLTADQKLSVDRIYAGSYACEEHDDFIWVFIPEPAPAGAGFTRRANHPSVAPRVPTFSEKYNLAHLTSDLPCSVDHGIIGLMDPAHGPFVHQAWWWRSRDSHPRKTKSFRAHPLRLSDERTHASSNSAPYKLLKLYADADAITTTIDFTLPNMRWETIRAGKYWFSSLTTVTPITRNRCRIDVVAAWNLFRWFPFGAGCEVCLREIRGAGPPTMERQSEGLKHNPHLMLIDDADRPAKWYFQLKQAWIESRREGTPFRHPISGPVTLKWRS